MTTHFVGDKCPGGHKNTATLTDAQLDEIEARAAAATPNEEWAKDRTVCSVVVDDGKTWIVYDDGDHAAQVHGNLGLDIDERAVAEFWAHAMTDIPALVAALRESREREQELKGQLLRGLTNPKAK